MTEIHSVVVAVDGESKCGKTTFINAIAGEAQYQGDLIPSLLEGRAQFEPEFMATVHDELAALQTFSVFHSYPTVSAGNMFRAAAFYAKFRNDQGLPKAAFTEEDTDLLRELLCDASVIEELQTNPVIEKSVSTVAKLPGVQTLCGSLFSDSVTQHYYADGGNNLVIIDARNPVGALQRNGVIGGKPSQIKASSILPIYEETPPEVAAAWIQGDYQENLCNIRQRRHTDATRPELPVKKPTTVITDYNQWLRQFRAPYSDSEVALPFQFTNTEQITLDDVQYFAGRVAMAAQDMGIFLAHEQAVTASR